MQPRGFSIREPNLPRDPRNPDTPQEQGRSLSTAERRLHSRQRVSSIACIELGDNNGGIILNISEGGLALAAVGVLAIDCAPRIRIQPPRSREWIELTGEIAWVGPSKKEAGIRFDKLTTEVQIQIKNWISSEIAATESPAESERFARSKAPQLAIPENPISGSPAPMPEISHAATIEQSPKFSSVPSTHALQSEQKGLTAPAALPDPRMIPDSGGETEFGPRRPERRLHARHPVKSLAYIELSESNGGLVLNMSEDGLHVQAAVTLTGDCFPLMRFQSPHAENRLETSGKLVWTSKSKREAGIQFVGLSDHERAKIREWVSSQPPPNDLQDIKDAVREKSGRPVEPQVTHEPEGPSSRPAASVPAGQKAVQPPKPEPISASSPHLAGARTAVFGPSIQPKELTGDAKQTLDEIIRVGRRHNGASRRNWVLPAAIGIVVGISFFLGRLVVRQSATVEAPMTAGAKAEPAGQSFQGGDINSASRKARPPNHAVESATPLGHHEKPAPVNSNSRVPTPPVVRVPAESGAAEQPAQSSSLQTTATAISDTRSSDHSTKIPPSTPIANSSGVSLSDKSSQALGRVSAQPTDTVAGPATPSTIASQPVPAVTVKKEGSTPASAKPQEEPAVPVGSVSISFPPFPSLRVPPELKSQTARLGTSLQFGQLISRVDPAYPEDARRQLIQGTVKLHAMIGRDGAVQTVALISGPAQLAPPAMSAIQQWRFKQTLLGGQPIETEEDITVVFRLTNSPVRSN